MNSHPKKNRRETRDSTQLNTMLSVFKSTPFESMFKEKNHEPMLKARNHSQAGLKKKNPMTVVQLMHMVRNRWLKTRKKNKLLFIFSVMMTFNIPFLEVDFKILH